MKPFNTKVHHGSDPSYLEGLRCGVGGTACVTANSPSHLHLLEHSARVTSMPPLAAPDRDTLLKWASPPSLVYYTDLLLANYLPVILIYIPNTYYCA